MICKGCKLDKDLRNSHIVPEWLYSDLYNNKHQFITISADMKKPEKKQKGLREKMLCFDCEQLLSRLESYAATFFTELESGDYKLIAVEKPAPGLQLVTQHDFAILKRFFLSILWRASVAKHEDFSEYSLGPYEEKIRKIVYGEVPPVWFDFPTLVIRILVGGVHSSIMTTNVRGKYGHKSTYSFTLNGYYTIFLVTEGDKTEKEPIFLREGTWAILDQDYSTLGIPGEIERRMMQADVSRFYDES